jgi:hypothetical protein
MLIMIEPNRELILVATLTSRFRDIVTLPFKLASNTPKIVYGSRGLFIFNNGR